MPGGHFARLTTTLVSAAGRAVDTERAIRTAVSAVQAIIGSRKFRAPRFHKLRATMEGS